MACPDTCRLDGFGPFGNPDQIPSDSQARLNQKPSTSSRLGRKLSAARNSAGMTQAQLAALAGGSVRGLWQAERGQGAAERFLSFAGILGMEVAGRSLPPGEHLGARILALRTRTGMSRSSLCDASGISRTTIAAIEAGRLGHLVAVERVGESLGAGLTLAAIGEAAAFFSSAALSSAWDAWATPQQVLDRLYVALGGGFDLDPCSPGRGRSRVRAGMHLTEDDDGLQHGWRGTAYMNPPYGRDIAAWTAKARGEVGASRASFVIGLLPARTDTRWWHDDVAGHCDIWLLKGRLAFGDGTQSAPFPSALVAWGASPGIRDCLAAVFPADWHIPAPRTGAPEMDLAAD